MVSTYDCQHGIVRVVFKECETIKYEFTRIIAIFGLDVISCVADLS
ncbi:hypothetical protein [Brevibacillus porteri]